MQQVQAIIVQKNATGDEQKRSTAELTAENRLRK